MAWDGRVVRTLHDPTGRTPMISELHESDDGCAAQQQAPSLRARPVTRLESGQSSRAIGERSAECLRVAVSRRFVYLGSPMNKFVGRVPAKAFRGGGGAAAGGGEEGGGKDEL